MSKSRSEMLSTAPGESGTLDQSVALARAGFACMFSTSDEYEEALIAERRAAGRYGAAAAPVAALASLPLIVFAAACLGLVAAVLLLR